MLVTCIQSELHFIDPALEGGRDTDLSLSYALEQSIVQGTHLTARVAGFAAPNINNKEAVSRDDNPQCNLLTPDPVYKKNAMVNNNVPRYARDVLSEYGPFAIIGGAKHPWPTGWMKNNS